MEMKSKSRIRIRKGHNAITDVRMQTTNPTCGPHSAQRNRKAQQSVGQIQAQEMRSIMQPHNRFAGRIMDRKLPVEVAEGGKCNRKSTMWTA